MNQTTALTHRRQDNELGDNVILFAEAGNEHYGNNVWELKTELPPVPDEVIGFASQYFCVDAEEAEKIVNPQDIVDSAEAWDDAQFVSEVWQMFEPVGFSTPDGAVVLDKYSCEIIRN